MSMISSPKLFRRLPLSTLVIAASLLLVETLSVAGMLALTHASPAGPVSLVRVSPQADRDAVYDQLVTGSTGLLMGQQSRLLADARVQPVQPCCEVAVQP